MTLRERVERHNQDFVDGKCEDSDPEKLAKDECPSMITFKELVFHCMISSSIDHGIHMEEGENKDGSVYRMVWSDNTKTTALKDAIQMRKAVSNETQ